MSEIGVAVLGCGFVGFRHALGVRSVEERSDLPVRLAAVADPAAERAGNFSETFGVPSYLDHRRLLARSDVQAVYVCTPTDTHLPLVREVAGSGRAVFCEKPLGRDLAEAEAVAEAVAEAGVPNQVGLVLRSSVVYQGLRSLLPELGELMAVVFRDDQAWPLERTYGSAWRGDRRVVGSGTLLEHSIHDLDLIRWLFGPPTVVGAAVAHRAGRSGVEDLAAALLAVEGGPVVTLTSVWHDIGDRRSERYLEVIGRRGRARVEADFWGPLELQGEEGPPRTLRPEELLARAADLLGLDRTERELWRTAPLEDYWFLEALCRGAEPSPSVAEGLEAHRLVHAVYGAAA